MTITDPSSAASTKWREGVGDTLSVAGTILTVYAGPHIVGGLALISGEYIVISGI